jgi:hypothetical protein
VLNQGQLGRMWEVEGCSGDSSRWRP